MKTIKNNSTLASKVATLSLSALIATSATATSLQTHKNFFQQAAIKSQDTLEDIGYMTTSNVATDPVETARWFDKAIKSNNLQGIYRLTTRYHFGSASGIMINYGRAIKLYTYAAQHGHADSAYNLGTIYFNGFGTEKNIPLAKKLYAQACDGGSQPACDVQNSFE